MKKEKLYTKYKFNFKEVEALCLLCKVTPANLEAKFDTLSEDEQEAFYNLIPMMDTMKQWIAKKNSQ